MKKNILIKLILMWVGDLYVVIGSCDENILFCLLFIL